MAAILKNVKSPYLRNRLTDFHEIWHDDEYLPPTADRPLKFRIFEIQDGGSRHLENHKIAISSQWIDRSLRNLINNNNNNNDRLTAFDPGQPG